MVAISLRTSNPPDLAVRVEPSQRRRLVTQRPDQCSCLPVQRFAVDGQRALAPATVEYQRSARRRSIEAAYGLHDGIPCRHDDAVRLLVGELDGRVGGQMRCADESALRCTPEHVAQADVTGQLRLSERVYDGHGLELEVLEHTVREPE